MIKTLLASAILTAGAGAIITARQSTAQVQREANAVRAHWIAQTQLVAAAQTEQAHLAERARALKQSLRQLPAGEENAVWSAIQTNLPDHLTPELRERLLEELGF